jgi:ribosomal protein L13E
VLKGFMHALPPLMVAVSVAAKEAHTNSKSYAQEQMAQAGMLTTCKDARNAGYSCKDAREAGFSYKEAREAGFTCKDAREAGFTCKDVREAGFTCKDAREAGFKPLECAQAGFTYEEGKVAGYPSHIGGNQTSEYWWRMGKLPSENLTPAAPLRLPLSGHRAPLPPGEAGRGGRAVPPRVRPVTCMRPASVRVPAADSRPLVRGAADFDWDGTIG